MSFASESQLDGMTRILRVLWGAFLAATIVYAAVAFLIVRSRGADFTPRMDPRLVRPIAWVIGALGLGVALLLRRRLLSRTFRDVDAALIGVQSALVVGWAATEAIAFIGLIVVFLGGGMLDGAPFFLAALLVVARQRPTSGWLREEVRAFTTGVGPSRIDP